MRIALRDALRCLVCLLLMTDAGSAKATTPNIEYPPRNQTVILYEPAMFGVIASGTQPLSYQWHKDGASLPGETNDQLVLPQSHFSSAGLYSVTVSDSEGNGSNVAARLTVNLPAAGDLDFSFRPGSSLSESVRSMVVRPDGKLLIGGGFSIVHGATRGRVALLNRDGSTDYTFLHGFSGANFDVNAIALQSDGKILIGGNSGDFTEVNGVPRRQIVRLNRDGSLDSGFHNGIPETNGHVYSIVIQPDGKILVGCNTLSGDGSGRNIVRLNSDGTLDSGFQNGLSGTIGPVYCVALQKDGKIIVGGHFFRLAGSGPEHLARLNADGTLDPTFQPQISRQNLSVYIYSLASDSQGRVVIGGHFSQVNGLQRNNIARLHADGTVDTNFLRDLSGANSIDHEVALATDDKLIIAGEFTHVNAFSCLRLARLNTDGSLDVAFHGGFAGADNTVYSVALTGDRIFVAGDFVTINNAARQSVARLNGNGTLDESFQNEITGANNIVLAAAVQADQKVLTGGWFTRFDGENRNYLARLNPDGTLDNGFLDEANVGIVRSLVVQSDGKILVNGIVRLHGNGGLDTGFRPSVWGPILSTVIQNDGKILIGGSFTNVNGVPRGGIARLATDGSLDASFQQGLSGVGPFGIVNAIALKPDGNVLIGGGFRSVNGMGRTNLAQLNVDGTLDETFFANPSGAVNAVLLQTDGKVVIGGGFSSKVARLNTDGSMDGSFLNQLLGSGSLLTALAIQPDGKILAGGLLYMTNASATPLGSVVRFHTNGAPDSAFQTRGGGQATCLALQDDGRILIGGWFRTVNGAPAAFNARLWGSAPSYIEGITAPNNGAAILTLRLPPGTTNRVHYKTTLDGNAWIDLPGEVVGNGSTVINKVDPTVGSTTQRFYRVIQMP